MTEAKWLACDDPMSMLEFLRGKASNRKLRLFAVACCRRIWHLITEERGRRAVEVAERFAEGLDGPDALRSAWSDANPSCEAGQVAAWGASWFVSSQRAASSASTAAWNASISAAWAIGYLASPDEHYSWTLAGKSDGWMAAYRVERAEQAESLRDIVGHPFRAVAVGPPSRTPDVVTLAGHIYHDRAFDLLPDLADALEEAGCSNPNILEHLRGPGPHARGCWPVDLLLGKS